MDCASIVSQVKGRYAPSPSGRMHLGNAMTALLSFLSAKSKGGGWLLRIEDLDTARCRYEYARILEEDLQRLGLEWDEGGLDAVGNDGLSYCQSRRTEVYASVMERLASLTYPCFCTRADIMSASAPHESDGHVVYPGTCRPAHFNTEPVPAALPSFQGRIADNGNGKGNVTPHSVRIFVRNETVSWTDGHYGPQTVRLGEQCGDFILRRSDGIFAYQLAVVADDALMGVTDVVRGRDLLLSTAQQIYLYRLLGYSVPAFFHTPLLCSADGRRLSKRDKSLDMGELFKHHSPNEIIGYLAYLCGLLPSVEPCTPKDLIPLFNSEMIPSGDIGINIDR